jgi:TRAP-type uncharacterized transport system substrate-binding protein
MSKRLRSTGVVVVALAMALLLAGPGSGEAQQKKNYSFVSSNPGGTWYNMVGGAIGLYNKEIPGVNFSVEATGGSVENVRRVATGRRSSAWPTSPTWLSLERAGQLHGPAARITAPSAK